MTARCLLGVILFLGGALPARGDEALDAAKAATGEGAKIFSSKNLDAMLATYAEDSQVEIISRNEATGGLKRDQSTGKNEIRKLYEDMFKTEGSIDARNTVETARFVGPEMLLITGTFEVSAGGRTSTFPFVQVRTRRDGKWLLAHVQVYVAPS